MKRTLFLGCLASLVILSASCTENFLTKVLHRDLNDYFSVPGEWELADAAAKGDLARIDKLIKQGVQVDPVGNFGVTPLAWAVGANNLAGTKRLLELGADPNRTIEEGNSILYIPVKLENIELFKVLLQHKGDPNRKYNESRTVMQDVLFQSDSIYLETLLQYGGDPNLNYDVNNFLEITTSLQHFDKTLLLLKHGGSPKLASLDIQIIIVKDMIRGYWAFSKDPAYNECLRILRESGLTIEIDPKAPTKESDKAKQESQ